ncbi:MAG: TlpA family protein disulfide reductase [Firmicutes bacterium]|nr:TlpA family protein disulfide reductase [Bacillota bacterium]
MKNMKQFLGLTLILVVFVAGSMLMYNSLLGKMDGGLTEDDISQPLPDFTVYDVMGTESHLSDYLGKPIILNFWASWCGPCKSEMPLFQSTYEAYGEEIQFLLVNSTDGKKETVATARQYLMDNGYTFPVLYDTAGDAAITYGIYALPMTLFIDEEGCLLGYVQGPISEELMQKGIALFGE